MPLLQLLKWRHFPGGWSSEGDTCHFLTTLCSLRFHKRFENGRSVSLLVCTVPSTQIISGAVILFLCIMRLWWCWGCLVNKHLTFTSAVVMLEYQALKETGSEMWRYLEWFKWELGACLWMLSALYVGWTVPDPLRLTMPCKELSGSGSQIAQFGKTTVHCSLAYPLVSSLKQCRVHGDCCVFTFCLSMQPGLKIHESTTDSMRCPVRSRHGWTKVFGKSEGSWETCEEQERH